LRQENLFLRSQLDGLNVSSSSDNQNLLPSSVYMSYPFNDKNLLVLGSGSEDNLVSNDAVVINRTLLGKVCEVFEHYSTFKTVFDPNWEFPVYIGPGLTRGLFKGGTEPKVVLISKKNKIEEGYLITTADPQDIPASLIIGTVGKITSDDSNPFWEITVDLPYNLNQVREVSILKK